MVTVETAVRERPEPRLAEVHTAAGGGTMYDPAMHAAALRAERARDVARQQERETAAQRHEVRVRAIALPLALFLGWLAVQVSPALVRFLAMWVHESGHATAAWLSGYMAFPGPWMTPVGSTRNYIVTLVIAGWALYGLQRAWKAERPFWVVAAVVVLAVTAVCTFVLAETQAEQLVLFAGDGGCFVLGSLLMTTMYAAPDHPVRKDGVCWGLLGIGSLAFMDAFRVWTGPFESLPFGEATNGVSDPSMLTEMYGWSIPLIVERYKAVAFTALACLAVVYVVGLVRVARTADSSQA